MKRVITFFLAMVVVFGLLPTTALAAPDADFNSAEVIAGEDLLSTLKECLKLKSDRFKIGDKGDIEVYWALELNETSEQLAVWLYKGTTRYNPDWTLLDKAKAKKQIKATSADTTRAISEYLRLLYKVWTALPVSDREAGFPLVHSDIFTELCNDASFREDLDTNYDCYVYGLQALYDRNLASAIGESAIVAYAPYMSMLWQWRGNLKLDGDAKDVIQKAADPSKITTDMREALAKQLGTYPESGTKEEQILWLAQHYYLWRTGGHAGDYATWSAQVTGEGASDTSDASAWLDGDSLNTSTDMYDLYAYALFRAYNMPTGWTSTQQIDTAGTCGTTVPMADSVECLAALKEYTDALEAHKLENLSVVDSVKWFQVKFKAMMGIASGAIDYSTAVEDTVGIDGGVAQRAQYFVKSAVENIYQRSNLIPRLALPKTKHIGLNAYTPGYLGLVALYQEFGMYATNMVYQLGDIMTAETASFMGRADDIRMMQSLYETVVWADDDTLWNFWRTPPKDKEGNPLPYSLSSIYDFLLSQNAFQMTEDYDISSETNAFKYFWGTSSQKLSSYMRTGIVASASFLPMKTNVYDTTSWTDLVPTDWLLNFHAKFGYNRKALLIDTNTESAMNYVRTGTRGSTRTATLKDLLQPDIDIVLYLDDNMYNVNEVGEIVDKAFTRLDNNDPESSSLNVWGSMWEAISGLWDESMANLAKTAEVTSYSTKIRTKSSNAGEEGSRTLNGKWDNFFFKMDSGATTTSADSDKEIPASIPDYLFADDIWNDTDQTLKKDYKAYSYNPLQGFAVISAIYRDPYGTKNDLNRILNKNTPVFISSATVPYLTETTGKTRNCIYNYMLLKNLDSQMSIDYATNLDMTSPVYMDIYGNIVTESGLVVVPAAANATLWNDDYLPYNAALLSTYGDDFYLPYNETDKINNRIGEVFTPEGDYWVLRNLSTLSGNVNLSRLSVADKNTLKEISEVFDYDFSNKNYEISFWEMIITEVLRGAPIEHIDKQFEQIAVDHRTTRQGLIIAEKLEFLVEALSSEGQNSTLTIPNPAYIQGLEYIVFFVYKVMILAIIVLWMFNIYLDTVGQGLGLRTVGKCIGIVVLVLAMIVGVPGLFELSYYQANRALLQDEAEYLMMLNLEKAESGHEIGITAVTTPTTKTNFYLHLATAELPWWDLIPAVATHNSVLTLSQLYSEYEGQHTLSGGENITTINDGIYISTEDLFNSSSITFNSDFKALVQRRTGATPASYYTPYYYFLDAIIAQVNAWNNQNQYYAYTTKVQRGGRIKTLGFVQPFFQSSDFMEEGMDYFGLYQLYDLPAPMQYLYSVDESKCEAARNSQWCNYGIDGKGAIKRVENINRYARLWVANNKDLIGKVTDETFLKCMALSCALEHNRQFNTMRADSLEIYELSNEDLMRLSIAPTRQVMENSTMSYARFVYTVGGTPAVYAAALLTLVNFLSSWIKPIVTMLVFCIACISIFVLKLILHKSNNSVYGYLTTIILMCSVNVLGALFLKLTMAIPDFGFSATVCILIQILIQVFYIFLLFKIVIAALRDWRNIGFQRYEAALAKMQGQGPRGNLSVDVATPKADSGWTYYDDMSESGRRRRLRA